LNRRRWRLACAVAYLVAVIPIVAMIGQYWLWW
jgi:hypothetical protein